MTKEIPKPNKRTNMEPPTTTINYGKRNRKDQGKKNILKNEIRKKVPV